MSFPQVGEMFHAVLLIEDDAIDHRAFKRLVAEEKLPYDYVIATNVAEARKALSERRFDIVITDYSLGDGSAFELFPLMKDQPVIIVTGTGDEEIAIQALKAGAYDYLIKDPDRYYLKVLPQTVENAIAHYRVENRMKLLSHAVMSASDSIYITDMDWNIVFVNRAFTDTYGYAEWEILGKSSVALWEDEGFARTSHERKNLTEPWHGEFSHRRKGGEIFPVSLTQSVVANEQGRAMAMVTVARDITEAKQVEEEMVRQSEELARSNAELEQFAYMASHDLQEPLRLLANGMKQLVDRHKNVLDVEACAFVDQAGDAVNRLQRMVNDLLAYSRVGWKGKEFAPVDCETVLGRAIFNLMMAIGENEAVVTHDPLPTVSGDEIQLTQLFQNLIANAVKFRKAAPPRVHVSAEKRGSDWLFSVRDEGIGIDMKYAEDIFMIFHRVHGGGKYQGTGIGLAISKRIVERHRGRIWVESEPGQGSTFFFTLPA